MLDSEWHDEASLFCSFLITQCHVLQNRLTVLSLINNYQTETHWSACIACTHKEHLIFSPILSTHVRGSNGEKKIIEKDKSHHCSWHPHITLILASTHSSVHCLLYNVVFSTTHRLHNTAPPSALCLSYKFITFTVLFVSVLTNKRVGYQSPPVHVTSIQITSKHQTRSCLQTEQLERNGTEWLVYSRMKSD